MWGGYASTPSDVIGLDGKAVQVECGMKFACALMEDGSMKCWGHGGDGQLGNDIDVMTRLEWDDCVFPTPVDVMSFGPEYL